MYKINVLFICSFFLPNPATWSYLTKVKPNELFPGTLILEFQCSCDAVPTHMHFIPCCHSYCKRQIKCNTVAAILELRVASQSEKTSSITKKYFKLAIQQLQSFSTFVSTSIGSVSKPRSPMDHMESHSRMNIPLGTLALQNMMFSKLLPWSCFTPLILTLIMFPSWEKGLCLRLEIQETICSSAINLL